MTCDTACHPCDEGVLDSMLCKCGAVVSCIIDDWVLSQEWWADTWMFEEAL